MTTPVFQMRTAEPRLKDGLISMCHAIADKLGKDKPFVIVEIGSFLGESASMILNEFPNATLYCVDPWKQGYDPQDAASSVDMEEVERRFDEWASTQPRVIKRKGVSSDFKDAEEFKQVDIVYIDGCHTYDGVKADIDFWNPRTRLAIAGHDYGYADWLAPVTQAVNDSAGTPDAVFSDSSWLKWKN